MIEIYCIAYNEEMLLPHFIKWYRDRFKDCRIVVYDNYSTDNTEKIALENNCEVIKYNTNNTLSDSAYLDIKNSCWKNAKTDWVLVCDVDEWLDINEESLKYEEVLQTTLIRSVGYNMCNVDNTEKYETITTGIRSTQYDKYLCFNKKHIQEVNYTAGAHTISAVGNKIQSKNTYNLLHMKFLNEDYMVDRYKMFAERMSEINKKNGWGVQYLNKEETIRTDYKNHLKASVNIYE